MAKCISSRAGVAAENKRGDWWEARYRSSKPLPWAAKRFGSTFAQVVRARLERRNGRAVGGFPLSDTLFGIGFILNFDGDGCSIPPASVTIERRVSVSFKLPAYSAGALDAALARAVVGPSAGTPSEPFNSQPWHRAAFAARFPMYFANLGSGSVGGDTILIDSTTTATLQLEEVRFRLNSPSQLAAVQAPAAADVSPLQRRPEQFAATEADTPTSRTIDSSVRTLTVAPSAEVVLLDAGVGGGGGGGGGGADAAVAAAAAAAEDGELLAGAGLSRNVLIAGGIGLALLAGARRRRS